MIKKIKKIVFNKRCQTFDELLGSPWRDKISLAILELQERGEIQILYDKWWKKLENICEKRGKNKYTKANSLGVDNIGGVFIVLIGGLALAILVAIFEFCYYSKCGTCEEGVIKMRFLNFNSFGQGIAGRQAIRRL